MTTPIHQTTREIIQLAKVTLTPAELDVWLTKHIAGQGRRSGSLALGITEDTFRYRLRRAEVKLLAALERQAELIRPVDQEKPAA